MGEDRHGERRALLVPQSATQLRHAGEGDGRKQPAIQRLRRLPQRQLLGNKYVASDVTGPYAIGEGVGASIAQTTFYALVKKDFVWALESQKDARPK